MDLSELLSQTLLLDLETSRNGNIRHIGAVLDDETFEAIQHPGSRKKLTALERFARSAKYILGHNLLGHDFPVLKMTAPWLDLLQKPVIDTLYLSPLAFPQNPYHRLVKDYKLVRTAMNSPVEDARLAASVFTDQWRRFAALAQQSPAVIDFYRFCFQDSMFNGFSGSGLSDLFSSWVTEAIPTPQGARDRFLEVTTGNLCAHAVRQVLPDYLEDPDRRPAVAYCLAWLQVAGGNSVLPPWVRHRFPEITQLIKALREDPCDDPDCGYCTANHDHEGQLRRFFGYRSFRRKPQTQDGESLQRAIANSCLGDHSVLGILPTGGGKSLCYQLPALVRYWRRGTLTVVVSPLQALMKDQVDNLVKKTGTLFAEVVSGLQTAPERGEVFERVRLGDTAILYLSPEQLRSAGVRNVLKQREIGCWVFDEAHCLSKWGHDFRPDYLYAARYIREFAEEQNQAVPPIGCFTATAKTSVIEEVGTHFREELGQDLQLFAGGVERPNLSFEVIPLSEAEKRERAYELIREHMDTTDEPGGVIVYAATRRMTEEIRDFLVHQGLRAEAFHAGLAPGDKREIIEAFVAEQIPVICATNAFGMGIDKENIRLVLHYQMPGSLENYIQEAGRAGRDLKPARCILFYDLPDVAFQFGLGAMSEVRQKEIARILRALRRKRINPDGEIVVTSDELLRDEDWAEMQALEPEFRDARIRTAVAWLERAGFLERNLNLTEVFQGRPLVDTIDAAAERMAGLNLSSGMQRLWLGIYRHLINTQEERGLRADTLAEALFPEKERLLAMEAQSGLTAAQIVLKILHDMADAGLVDKGLVLSATFRPRGKHNAFKVFQTVCDIENRLIKQLQVEEPDAEEGHWLEMNLRRLNQKLANDGCETSPDVLRTLIKGIAYDGKGFAASKGSFEIGHIDRDRYRVRLNRSWAVILKTIALRQNVADLMLRTLADMAARKSAATGGSPTGEMRLAFSSDQLSAALKADLILSVEVKKALPAIERALMFLHEQHIIELHSGLAILRQAMTLRLARSSRGRHYRKGDYAPLAVHYRERRFQVHVMMRYATLALEKIAGALALVLDYFALGRANFIRKYFDSETAILEKATTAESFRRIVDDLRNPVQISAVASPVDDSMLILAGPGSGKTRVIVHRCAYLLEVERIPARQILVLCFNHSSARVLQKRLHALVGKAARGVTIATYHGVAMRLAGISVRDMAAAPHGEAIDFDRIIKDAVQYINGAKEIPGIAPDEHRDRLLAGYSHILVDEYQDIDEDQYDLVSAIAGRSLAEEDGRLAIMAVGDDDQNIYTFRGANVRFIRQFQDDYSQRVTYLVENYRSSRHIIAAANALIRRNRDRMKGDHPIEINHERKAGLPGGRWEHIDPVGRGNVQIVSVRDLRHQARYIQNEMERLRMLDPGTAWHDFAVLSRTKAPLAAIRAVLEDAGSPIKTVLDTGFPLHRVREVRQTLDWLESRERRHARATELKEGIHPLRGDTSPNPWWALIDTFFDSYGDDTLDSILPVGRAVDGLYDFVAEQRREKAIGEGVFLSTVHGAKGMEFPHVFILDGDWHPASDHRRQEEERRILYVGMTRARETLRLMKLPGTPNPFLGDIGSRYASPLIYRGVLEDSDDLDRSYAMLGLDEIFLDYAGRFPRTHPIHEGLAALQPGQSVTFRSDNARIGVHDNSGLCLARLSNEGAARWAGRLAQVLEVRIVAVLTRHSDDPDEDFQGWIRADAWELPMLEVVYRSSLS